MTQPIEGNTSLPYEAPPLENPVVTQHAIDLLRQTGLWTRIFSVLLFISGGIMILCGPFVFIAAIMGGPRGGGDPTAFIGLIYPVMGILYVIPGIFLWRFATHAKAFAFMRNVSNLEGAMQAQKTFWKFTTLMVLIIIGLYLLAIPIIIIVAVAASHP